MNSNNNSRISKSQALQTVKDYLSSGLLSPDDLSNLINQGSSLNSQPNNQKLKRKSTFFNFTNLISLIGGIAVFIGSFTLVSLNWSYFTPAAKVLIPLVSGILFSGLGLVLVRQKNLYFIANSIQIPGVTLIPVGIIIFLQEFGSPNRLSNLIVAGIFVVLGSLYVLLNRYFKQALFVLTIVIHYTIGASMLYAFAFQELNMALADYLVIVYFTISLGISYLFLGRYLKNLKPVGALVDLAGLAAILFAPFSIMEKQKFWEIGYVILVALFLYIASKLESKIYSTMSVLGFVLYLIYISLFYFTDYLGGPLTLVFSGFILILISIIAIKFNKSLKKNKP